MNDEELDLLRRICAACERLEEVFAHRPKNTVKPAVLGTATYSDEEKNKLEFKKQFGKKDAEKP